METLLQALGAIVVLLAGILATLRANRPALPPAKKELLSLERTDLVARSLRRALSHLATVSTTTDPAEAERVLAAKQIDLLLSDSIGLPLIRRLQGRYPKLKIVVYSGGDAPAELPPGVARWISKSAPTEDLTRILEELLKKETR